MPQTMQALVKPEPKAGIEVREVPLPNIWRLRCVGEGGSGLGVRH